MAINLEPLHSIIWNGVSFEAANLPAFYSHLGVGIFETFRLNPNSSGNFLILGLKRHFQRLQNGLGKLDFSQIDENLLLDGIKHASKGFRSSSILKVRIIVTNNNLLLTAEELKDAWPKPAKVVSFQGCRSVPELKNCSALTSYLSHKQALEQGATTALLTQEDLTVTECSWANFFWFDQDANLFTASKNILQGVTRQIILDNQSLFGSIRQCSFSLQTVLSKAKEAFLTQATTGIVPITHINTMELPDSNKGLLVKKVAKTFQEISKQEMFEIC